MNININPTVILLALPSLITLIIALRVRRRPWQETLSLLGWRSSSFLYYGWGVLIAVIVGGLTTLTLWLFAPDLLLHPAAGTVQFSYVHLTLNPLTLIFIFLNEAIFSTLGEEILFRGWLEGWLVKRIGFLWGNTLQSLIFLLPHLLLLLVNSRLGLILPFQLLAGWLLGWLRYRSGSILPGWLSHTLVNVISDIIPLIF